MSNFKLNKKAIMGAALLATSPTIKAGGTGGGFTQGSKSQRGINHLTLEEAPLENVTICARSFGLGLTGNFRYLQDKIAVIIDSHQHNFVKMTFVVSHMTAMDYDRLLLLAYSPKLSLSPQIPTPKSINKLELDLTTTEIIGVYTVSAFGMKQQPPTRIGRGNPAPRVKWEFDINLDTTEIPLMMSEGQDTIYVQAALIKRSDFEAEKFDGMILSEMDTIQFVQNECSPGLTEFGVTNSEEEDNFFEGSGGK